MKRGSSSSWEVALHWDVAPEEVAVDDEGSQKLTPGQEEFVNELLEVYFRGVMNARNVCVLCHWVSLSGGVRGRSLCTTASLSVGQVPKQTRRSAGHWEGRRRLLHKGNPTAESRRPRTRSTSHAGQSPPRKFCPRSRGAVRVVEILEPQDRI